MISHSVPPGSEEGLAPPRKETGAPKSSAFFLSRAVRWLAIFVSLLAMAATLYVFGACAEIVSWKARVMPLDSYFYQSMAANIQEWKGPRVDWPQGPNNKYFPGFAYWWALFLPRHAHPDLAIRSYALAQTVLLLLLMLALTSLGRIVWRDWPVALAFAAIAGSAPVVLKWGAFPMTELMAGVCTTACAAAALFLLRKPARGGSALLPGATGERCRGTRLVALACLTFFGTVGLFTRLETAYVLGLLVLWLLRRKEIRWTGAAGIFLAAALPLALWQLWITRTFHEANAYIAEGTQSFQFSSWFNLVLFQYSHFIRVPNVEGPVIVVNYFMVFPSLLFMVLLVVSLRGYLGSVSGFSAWLVLGYWLLHALWYYRSERYNGIVLCFGFLFFMEGLGWLYHRRLRWRARGGTAALAVLCLLHVPPFVRHGMDNMEATIIAINRDQPVLPPNQGAIRTALGGNAHPPAGGAVFLSNLSLPETRRLPGPVWMEKPDYVSAPYIAGKAREFMRAHAITHLALKPPVEEWLRINGQGLQLRPLYADEMIWLARVEGYAGAPAPELPSQPTAARP